MISDQDKIDRIAETISNIRSGCDAHLDPPPGVFLEVGEIYLYDATTSRIVPRRDIEGTINLSRTGFSALRLCEECGGVAVLAQGVISGNDTPPESDER